jgi:hypothetical protein
MWHVACSNLNTKQPKKEGAVMEIFMLLALVVVYLAIVTGQHS